MFKAKRVIKQAMERFIDFSNTLPERQRSKNPNPETIQLFINYLNDISREGGAASTYTRFKKVMTQAVKDGILSSNPCICALKLLKSTSSFIVTVCYKNKTLFLLDTVHFTLSVFLLLLFSALSHQRICRFAFGSSSFAINTHCLVACPLENSIA